MHEHLGGYGPDALGKLLHRAARDRYLIGYGDALALLLGDERREGVEVEVHPYPYRGALVELAWLDVAQSVEGEGERTTCHAVDELPEYLLPHLIGVADFAY